MIGSLAYPLLAVLGMAISAYVWERVLDRQHVRAGAGWNAIFIGALIGMATGAKLGYALAEGFWIGDAPVMSAAFWLQAFSGKTVTGGLLGAYLGVEFAKRRVGHTEPTGDTFAVIAPLSLMLGRVGCLFGGCCLGVAMEPAWFTVADAHGIARWPAVWVEFAFNALFFAFAIGWTRRRRHASGASDRDRWRGQLFHVYLIAYGAFRLAHEFVRDTPRIAAGLSGYQLLSIAILALGAIRFAQRQRQNGRPGLPSSQ
jgi:phosphatidylglycerol:prolipoprotein diacylglycerol transferase